MVCQQNSYLFVCLDGLVGWLNWWVEPKKKKKKKKNRPHGKGYRPPLVFLCVRRERDGGGRVHTLLVAFLVASSLVWSSFCCSRVEF